MPRWLAHALVVVGWLLTPLLAWGASRFGLWAGALFAIRLRSPAAMLATALVTAFAAGLTALWLWVHFMRRLPHRLSHLMAPLEDEDAGRPADPSAP